MNIVQHQSDAARCSFALVVQSRIEDLQQVVTAVFVHSLSGCDVSARNVSASHQLFFTSWQVSVSSWTLVFPYGLKRRATNIMHATERQNAR